MGLPHDDTRLFPSCDCDPRLCPRDGSLPLKWTQPKTGTEWVVALVPLGGYVRMEDASFDSKPLAARSWIVFAGPLANLIFAAVAYSFLFSADRQEPQAVLGQPPVGSIAAAAGITAGDQVVAVDGRLVRSFTELRWRMAQALVGEGSDQIELSLQHRSSQVREEGAAEASYAADPALAIASIGLLPLSQSVKILRIQEASAAADAGLRVGDRILQVSGEPVFQPETMIARVQASGGRPIELIVSNTNSIGSTPSVGSERVLIRPKPGADGVYRIGAVVGADVATVEVSDDLVTAVSRGVSRTWEMTVLTFQALGRMIVGEISWRQISGPVTIADAAGQSAGSGLQPFIGFLALISISIAVLNLLPIPMLDGGHLLYYLWEFVRGSPLSAEVQDAGRRMGVALIILLTTVALFNDFSRLAGW
ncbi:MAG: hypothetical protein RL132_1107 [Pseudomonadota bacterium]